MSLPTIRMAIHARRAVVHVPLLPLMFVVQLILIRMTCLCATECIHVICRMALIAVRPFIRVLMLRSGINRKRGRIVLIVGSSEETCRIP